MADTLKEILMARSTVAQARNERDGIPAKSNLVVLQMTPEHLIARVRAGFEYQEFELLRKRLELSLRDLARLTQIPERTLMRRKQAGRLDPSESEKLLRLERLLALAEEMFRDVDKALRWLKTPKSALDGNTPLEYAATEVGAREVENLIGRIRHGVFS
jgi:putative toxin-antitoxin system antitoxin component (TIGR02293 family)